MKKITTLLLGLLILGVSQIHSMEQQQELNKEQQKEFRAALAGYRGAYILQQMLERTGRTEVKAEARLRKDYGDILETYKQLHGETPYVKHKLERLEKFKNKEVPAIFEQLAKLKTEDL